jgi:hypothetical protein
MNQEENPGQSNMSLSWKVVVLFDASGSMLTFPNAVDTINEFIASQKKSSLDAQEVSNTLSLYFFNDDIQEVFVDKLMADVDDVKPLQYVPDGSTALYDAVGITLEKFNDTPRLFMVILTDGFENSSLHYTSGMVHRKIRQKKEDGWTFKFLGTNQDSWKTGKTLGLDKSDTENYECSQPGLLKIMRTISDKVSCSITPKK